MSSNRQKRAQVAIQTNEILHDKEYMYHDSNSSSDDNVEHEERGGNMNSHGHHRISIASELEMACAGTLVLDEKTTNAWRKNKYKSMGNTRKVAGGTKNEIQPKKYPNVRVVNTTTFAAAKQIYDNQKKRIKGAVSSNKVVDATDVLCLNFGSAKHKGGGFLKGSQAQEESLARASGLYSCLLQASAYYNANRSSKRHGMYEDLIIYSPDVPVFRDDNDVLIRHPWKTSIITAPAPNRGALTQRQSSSNEEGSRVETLVRETFEKRIDMVLSTATHFGHRNLILGAWGCGVFKNDPKMVASLFKKALLKKNFEGAFDNVIFAVLDRTKGRETFDAFNDAFVSFSRTPSGG